MKTTINQSAFIDAFVRYDRFDQFGYDALVALFDYLEALEDDIGEELELDVLALCCDYSVDTLEDIMQNYSLEDGADVVEWLHEMTTVVDVLPDGRVLYCSSF